MPCSGAPVWRFSACAAGEFVTLIGPSGSGKSTLFNLIVGLTEADAGRGLFRIMCRPCHGISAQGGRGPDLTLEEIQGGSKKAASIRERLIALGAPRVRVEPMPDFMLAEDAEKPFSDPNFIFELKYDGYRLLVVVEDGPYRIAFKQIAGLIARRILPWVHVGELINRSERISLIQFGSRVDVLLPLSAQLLVEVGDTVKAGKGAHPQWEVPAGWVAIDHSSFLVAKFRVTGDGGAKAEINVSTSSGTCWPNLPAHSSSVAREGSGTISMRAPGSSMARRSRCSTR